MGKRVETRRDVILQGAKQRMEDALFERDLKRVEASNAQVRYEAAKEVYEQLSLALARQPRSNGSAPKPKSSPRAKHKFDEKCAHAFPNNEWCFALSGDAIHDIKGGYLSYHPFVSSSDAPSAKRRSSSVSAPKKDGEANMLAETMNVSSVSNVEGN